MDLYSSFSDTILKWMEENNLKPSEEVYLTMENVVNNLGETWYRASLGKLR